MRRMVLAASGVVLGAALMVQMTVVRAEQPQDAAMLDTTMKTVGASFGATRKALGGAMMAEAKTGADALSKAFVETEAFFKSHGKADGVEWAQGAKKAADAIAAATTAEAATAAAGELGKHCAGCHAKYRDKAADGGFSYKPGN